MIHHREGVADFLSKSAIVVVPRAAQDGVDAAIECVDHEADRRFSVIRFCVVTISGVALLNHPFGLLARRRQGTSSFRMGKLRSKIVQQATVRRISETIPAITRGSRRID